MYAPGAFRIGESEALAFVERCGFGTLVSTLRSALVASHLPFLLERDGDAPVLLGHMARANEQWRELAEREALVVFLGPHGYISPRWYESRDNVPTWDYMAVHAYGRARIVDDRQRVLDVLASLAHRFESGENPWTLRDLDETRRDAFVAAIVAFEIPVARIEGSFKLSQNRSPADRAGVVAALRRDGFVELADAVAGGA